MKDDDDRFIIGDIDSPYGKWTIIIAICLIIAFLCFPTHAQETPFPINAETALVIDSATNEVLIDKNSMFVRPIASITKLMTAVVTLDQNLPLDEEITITQDDVNATMLHRKPTSGRLPMGTVLTRAELLHLALMNSQNRAAAALARTYPGGVEAFVAAMNHKAEMLGMMNTHYVDPTGLWNDNTSTAIDLATLVEHASQYVIIRDFSTAESFELTMYKKRKAKTVAFGTTNVLIHKPDWQIYVQKTGYIRDAGRCVVMKASIGSRDVVIVLLNAVSSKARAFDAMRIKHWVETGEILAPLKQAKKKVRRG